MKSPTRSTSKAGGVTSRPSRTMLGGSVFWLTSIARGGKETRKSGERTATFAARGWAAAATDEAVASVAVVAAVAVAVAAADELAVLLAAMASRLNVGLALKKIGGMGILLAPSTRLRVAAVARS
jgi:hypothetical protein